MEKSGLSAYSIRALQIEGKNLTAQALLKLAQPMLGSRKATVAQWEAAELLLVRALWELGVVYSDHLKGAIIQKLPPIATVAHCRYSQIREQARFGLFILKNRLCRTSGFERLLKNLLPNKRRLHPLLTVALCDLNLLAHALCLTLELQRRFQSELESLLRQLRTAVRALNGQSGPVIDEINKFCDDPQSEIDGPYEENAAKFEKLFSLRAQLKQIARRRGLEQLLQPTPAEQLEDIVTAQTALLEAQARRLGTADSAIRIMRLNHCSLALNRLEMDALIAPHNQTVLTHEFAAQETLRCGLALVAATANRNCSDTVRSYLRDQLRSSVQQLEWLASYPCKTPADIRFAMELKNICKKWGFHLKQLLSAAPGFNSTASEIEEIDDRSSGFKADEAIRAETASA